LKTAPATRGIGKKRLCVPLAKLRVVPEGTVISKADLLVLAEPTNHLDIKAPGPPEDDPGKH
jgi:hypothetical protein